jgi:uncharacterized membrane protein
MTRKVVAIAALMAVASMTAASVAAGLMLPEDLRLPTHWGLSGEPDAFAGKWTALLLPPGIMAAVSLLFYALPVLEPRREGLARSQGLYLWGWLAVLAMGGAIELALLSAAFGWGLPVNQLIVGAIGAMLVLIGNQLGKSRSMYLIGLRTPWTLASEEVWIKTHRLAGKLMVAAGLTMMLAALLPLPSGLLATISGGAIAVAAGVPIVYSFLLWRRERGVSHASE